MTLIHNSNEFTRTNIFHQNDIAPANTVSFSTAYSNKYLTGNGIETPALYLLAHGKLVARKTRILNNGYTNNWGSKKWVTSVSFYDEDGNVIQTHTKNPWSDELEGEWDITTNQYNFNGQPVLSILDHPGTGNGNRPSGAIVQVKKTYDQFNGRLQTTEHRIGDVPATPWYNLNRYVYDELGKVAQKDLGFVERQEYKYNIRGELRSINDLYVHTLTPAAANKVTYASILGYDTDFDDKRYDGKLSGYQWCTAGSADPMAYGYTYDDAGRMTHAEYRYNNGSSWIKTARDYTTSNLAYDANGNMQSMTQKGESSFLNAVTTIDDLSYQYDASGTRLLNVEDNGNNSSVRNVGIFDAVYILSY